MLYEFRTYGPEPDDEDCRRSERRQSSDTRPEHARTLQIPRVTGDQTRVLPEICYISPTVRDDFKPVVRSLKDQKPVIVNFSETESRTAMRAYNCMLGAVYALDGSVDQITSNVLLFAPKEIEVSRLATAGKGKDMFKTLV